MSIRAPPKKARPLVERRPPITAALTGPNAQITCSADCVAAPGDEGDALRTDMLGVNFAGGNGAAVSDTERLSLPVTGQRDLAADHHDARIPIMGVVGVHHPGLEPTIEDLVTLASQIGFEFSLVHDKPSCEQVRTKRLGRPAASYRYACAPTRASADQVPES